MKDHFSRINPTTKGIILAFLATLGMANVYIFSKAALLEVNYFQFQFYWFGFALIWILPFLLITGMIKKIPLLSRSSNISLVIIGLLELGSASMLFLAIQLSDNPTTISFLSNLTPIFVTILGIRFLGERFNTVEAIGIILTIGGVILISYTRDTSISEFFGKGSGWILVSSIFASVSIITAKSRNQGYSPRNTNPQQGNLHLLFRLNRHAHSAGEFYDFGKGCSKRGNWILTWPIPHWFCTILSPEIY